jgi:hypothetical protein
VQEFSTGHFKTRRNFEKDKGGNTGTNAAAFVRLSYFSAKPPDQKMLRGNLSIHAWQCSGQCHPVIAQAVANWQNHACSSSKA